MESILGRRRDQNRRGTECNLTFQRGCGRGRGRRRAWGRVVTNVVKEDLAKAVAGMTETSKFQSIYSNEICADIERSRCCYA